MPVLKAQCPECETKLRLDVPGPGDHDAECPKCGHEFVATLEDDDPPAKPAKAKKGDTTAKPDKGTKEKAKPKAAAKRGDDEDDDAPKKKKGKQGDATDDGGKKKLVIAGAVAGLLLLVGLGGVIYAVANKNKTAKKSDTPADTTPQPQPPGPNVPVPPGPGPGPNPPPKPKDKEPNPPPPKPKDKEPDPKPKDKEPTDAELATTLPPPPRIKISGSAVPPSKPVVKPPAIPPLAQDEDPFFRAKEFKLEGGLPELPALPARKDRPILTLEAQGHTDTIEKVFFTPKGDRVITIGRDTAVRIWNPATNDCVQTIRFPSGPGAEGSLQAAAISRTGKQLAVAGRPVGTLGKGARVPIYIISPETGAQIAKLDLAPSPVLSMHFSQDGKWLGVGCENGAIQVIDVAAKRSYPAPALSDTPAAVLEVKYNPNPKFKLLATLGADRYVQIWNFANVAQHKDFAIRGARPSTLAWSTDGRTLAVGTTTGEIMLGTSEGQLIKTLPAIRYNGKPVAINQLQYLPDNNDIAVCGLASGVGGWAGVVNAETGAVRTSFKQHTNTVFSVDVSPDGAQVVSSGGNQHESFVWAADTGSVLHRFVGTGKGVWALGWSKDGKSLAWGNSNVAGENGEKPLQFTFRLDEFGVGDTPDPSKYVQAHETDDRVKVTRIAGGVFAVQTPGREPEAMLLNDGERIYAATVLPKSNAVVVTGTSTVALINPATARENLRFVGHTGNVTCATPSPDGRLFATGSADQTIRIWQRDLEDPLLSIFVSGRDWIAWTPQGFYACSAQAERMIAWQLPAAPNKPPVIHPAERFRSSMYQPALLKYIVPTGNLQLAMAMAQKYDKALIKTTNVADVLPPEVTLEGFGDAEVKVEKDTLLVRATAKSAKNPVTAMRLLVNGRPYQGAAGVKRFDTPLAEATAQWEVPLPPGTHTVAVIADSAVSKGMSKVGVATKAGVLPKPNLYVLAVGVSDYAGKSKLNYCATDAELLAKTFKEQSKAVFTNIEVKVLTDKAATKAGILAGLDWLKSKMTAQDVGIVSFSGHGTRDSFGQFYLCPIDMNPADGDDMASFLSGKLFKDRLDEMPGRLVAILDACHSGTVAEKGPPAADTLVRDLTAEDSGVIVMCASAGREYATESKLTKAGFYTLGLVEGMSGYGDVDGDGVVYIHELDLYATARVQQLSGGKQNPTLGRPQTVRPFAIAKPDKLPTP